jgi:hypothetical protein
MSRKDLSRLLREWVALFAILAMALGPLALATSRSLGAVERIAVASGAKPLLLCLPGGSTSGGESQAGGADCDHCLPVQPFAPPIMLAAGFAADRAPAPITVDKSIRLPAQPRAPPARGPPTA